MTLPSISALCVTYGRPPQMLAECIECFLRQDYRGPKELVILNTFPDQELFLRDSLNLSDTQVRIINLKERPASLGEARNIAVMRSTGSVLVTWDSDDLYLPHHLSNFGEHWRDTDHWLRQSRAFFIEAGRITKIIDGTTNVVAFTRQAWKNAGGYARTSCGEDTQFFGKLSALNPGRNVRLSLRDISFLYAWNTGQSHISGFGADAPGKPLKYDQVARMTAEQVAARRIPVGRIELTPALTRDYAGMAQAFIKDLRELDAEKVGHVGLILLGRYGDILNILPVARHISQVYDRPHFFVAREFANVLDGVSYVIPEVLDLPYDRIHEAIAIARQRCQMVLVAQVWGKDWVADVSSGSYNTSSWHQVGMLDHFYDSENWPLVLDRRTPAREVFLTPIASCVAGVPSVLLNLQCSASSPFAQAEQLVTTLRQQWRSIIVDTCQIKSDRIYDLLTLLDRASILITADTALLHLAAASQIPVIALVNDNDWLGSIPRCNCVLRLRYSDALPNLDRINQIISECVK